MFFIMMMMVMKKRIKKEKKKKHRTEIRLADPTVCCTLKYHLKKKKFN